MTRRRLSWILVIALLIGASYAATPWAARQLVEIWLLEQGFEDPRFTISHPAWDRFEITEISLSKTDTERRLALNAGPILIRYHPTQLILNQQLTEIQVPQASLSINYKPAINEQTRTDAELALLPLLPTQLIGLIPANRVLVGELAIQLSTPERPDWHFRGSMDLTRYELISRVHMRYGLEELGWSDIRFDDRQRFNLKMLYQDEAFLNVEGHIDTHEALTLNFSQQTHLERLHQWLKLIAPDSRQWPAVTGKISSHGTLQLPLSLALDQRDWLSEVSLEQQLDTAVAVDKPHPELERLVLKSQQTLTLQENTLQLRMNPDSSLKLTPRLPELALPALDARLTAPWQLDLPFHNPMNSRTSQLQMTLTLPPWRNGDMFVRSTPASLTLDPLQPDSNQLQGKMEIAEIRVRQPAQKWPVLSFSQQFQLDPEQLQSRFSVRALQTPLRLNGNVSWYNERQLADINWQLQPLGLKKIEHLIRRYAPQFPSELNLTAGLLEHRGWGRWQQGNLNLTLRQSARNVRFNWDQLSGQQGLWRSELRLSPNGRWRDKGQLRLGLLDAGLPLEQIRSFYELHGHSKGLQRARFNSSQLDLLGGQIRLSPFTWDRQQDHFETIVDVDQLQVSQLLALEQQPGLKGSGVLSGQLPVSWQQGQITVTGGELHSQPPGGYIRFEPDESVRAIAGTNRGLKMALEALQNFQYDELKIGVTYLADGTALLDTRLKGRNPDWNNGRPVNLGVNVEENLPKLIHTLQLTDQLTNSLKKRYR